MRVIVTCGPSYEPIDEVRRLTNFSTGELGTLLASALVQAGYETICLRGVAATWRELPIGAEIVPFTTNDNLADRLRELGARSPVTAIFHTAALADYRVAGIQDGHGAPLQQAKIPTQRGALTLRLEPATKVLPLLQNWFPGALRIGWKYELDGSRDSALALALRQIQQSHVHASVLNGRAYGEGFGVVHPDAEIRHVRTKALLCEYLAGDFLKNSKLLLASDSGQSSVSISNRGVEQPGSSSGS